MAVVLGVVSRMGRNTQGFLWGMSDTTWNGCQVQVLDTTKEGLTVHVVEGTPSQQAACWKYHEGRSGGWALKGRRQPTQSRHCPAASRSNQGKIAKWSADMSGRAHSNEGQVRDDEGRLVHVKGTCCRQNCSITAR